MQLVDPIRQRGVAGGVAAGPDLALAATCFAGLFVEELALRILPSILEAVAIEGIGIFLFPFLVKIAFAKTTQRWTPARKRISFVAVAAFLSASLSVYGARAVGLFWTLTVTTFFGFLVHDAPERRQTLFVYRWIASLLTLIGAIAVTFVVVIAFGLEGPRRGALFGFLFFSTLGVMDWTNFYDRLIDRPRRRETSFEFDDSPGAVPSFGAAFSILLFGLVWTAFSSLILYVVVKTPGPPVLWVLALFPLIGAAIVLSGTVAIARAIWARWGRQKGA